MRAAFNHSFQVLGARVAPDRSQALTSYVSRPKDAVWLANWAYRARFLGSDVETVAYVHPDCTDQIPLLVEFFNEVESCPSKDVAAVRSVGRVHANMVAMVEPRALLLRDPGELLKHTNSFGAVSLDQTPDVFNPWKDHGVALEESKLEDFDPGLVTMAPSTEVHGDLRSAGGGIPEMFERTRPWVNLNTRFFSRNYKATGLGTVFLGLPDVEDDSSTFKVANYQMDKFLDAYPDAISFV